MTHRLAQATAAGLILAGCLRTPGGRAGVKPPPPLPNLALMADSIASDTLALGVVHHAFVIVGGPWRIHVLDVDRAACWSLEAVKAGGQAVGRVKTSELIEGLARQAAPSRMVAGGVNADFFSFTPPGVPSGATVHNGLVITGPGSRPVLASDSSGRAWIGVLSVWGRIAGGSDTFPIEAWNRPSASGVSYLDPGYGPVADSAQGTLRIALGPGRRRRVTEVDSSGGAFPIPEAGGVVSLGTGAAADLRRRLLRAATGATPFDVAVGLVPFYPREAVGGFPVLVQDSAEAGGLDAAGGGNFGPVRHPRTVVGIGAGGRRILLVVVDGRQEGYSMGMTLRETAQLLRDLGATSALNLDGGGSTTMVTRRTFSEAVRFTVANRPSDQVGERPVGNALAVISSPTTCPTR